MVSGVGCSKNPLTPPPLSRGEKLKDIPLPLGSYEKRDKISVGCRIHLQRQISVAGTPQKTEGDRSNLCHKHQRVHCPSCVFYLEPVNAKWKNGKILQDPKVDSPTSQSKQPLFGHRARFNPSTHCLAGIVGEKRSGISGTPKNVPFSDSSITLGKSWFIYCPQCQLSYLVGNEGYVEATNHPAHLIQADPQERTIAVFVDGSSEKDITDKENNHYKDDDSEERWNGQFSVYHGPNSRYNGHAAINAYKDESHLLYAAFTNTLAHFADQIPLRRRREIRNQYAVTNSHQFLRDCSVFRLLVLVGGGPSSALRKFMPLIGPTARDFMETDSLLAAQEVGWRWSAARVQAKESIADEVRNLARMGILVEWYECHESSCPLP